MVNFDNLRVFNKNGDLLNHHIENNVIRIPVNLQKVSTNLIETERLYILEEVTDGNILGLSKPKFFSQTTLLLNDNEFSFFKIDQNTSFINTNINGDYFLDQFIDDSNESYQQNKRVVTSFNPTPMVIDVMFMSREDGGFSADATLKYNDELRFELYCETEEADERLVNLLSRFGESLSQNEEIIFRESDVNDDHKSNILLNTKRKELLNSINEITHLTSIRGLEFIIEYFGYSDIVEIKEYYYDKNINKIISFKHDDFVSNREKYTKLSEFGLTYKLNEITDEVNEFGLPKLKDTFPIPIEEIIIKFVALKNYIEARSIGGVSKIIDIIGERLNFSGILIKNWTNKNETFGISKQTCPTYDLKYVTQFIDDLRKYETLVCPYPQTQDLSAIQIGGINQCYVGYFANTFKDDVDFFDEPNLPIGGIVELRNSTFDVAWEDIDIVWLNNNSPLTITWQNIGGIDYTRCKWIIKNNRGFLKEVELYGVNMQNIITVILPHDGHYDVVLELYGYNNLISRTVDKNSIYIKLKEVELTTFHKLHNKDLQVWESCYLPFGGIYADWNDIIYDNSQFITSFGELSMRTYSMVNYPMFKTKDGYGELSFYDLSMISWNEYGYMTWNDHTYNTKILPRAIIDTFIPGDTIQINDVVLAIPNINIYNFVGLVDSFNQQTDEYEFVIRKDNNNNTFVEVTPSVENYHGFIIGTNGNSAIGSSWDLNTWDLFSNHNEIVWTNIPTTWVNSTSLFFANGVDEEFNHNNLRFFRNEFECPQYVPIFFSIDDCDMVGKTKCEYVIKKSNGESYSSYNGLYYCKRFAEKGFYSVECTITDTNGNTNKIHKNNIIKIT